MSDSPAENTDLDRVLDAEDVLRVAEGRAPKGGNGSWAPFRREGTSGEGLTGREARQLAIQRQRKLRLMVEEMAEGEYKKAIARIMGAALEGKEALLISLIEKGTLPNGDFDISLLDPAEKPLMLKVIESFENRFLGTPTNKVQADIQHSVVDELAALDDAWTLD